MGKDTKIQWADSTVNPTTGCDGCELWGRLHKGPCYAGHLHEGRLARSLPKLYAPSFTEVRLAPGRTAEAAAWPDLTGTSRPDKPWLDGLPRLVFVGDMGDLFSKAVPFEHLKAELIDTALSPKGRRHVYLALTKQTRRASEFWAWLWCHHGVNWPSNLWLGTSLTNRRSLVRLGHLQEVPANLFVSAEPMWEDLVRPPGGLCSVLRPGGPIKWLIMGGQSDQKGHPARPFDVRWAAELIGLCRARGVAPFVKQLGSDPQDHGTGLDWPEGTRFRQGVGPGTRVLLKDAHGGDWSEWPGPLRVREVPDFTEAA